MKTRQKGEERGLGRARREVVRGAAEQVILVRVPVPGMFREAVFFLHEDYLRRSDMSRETLLRQAREAAEDWLRPYLPQEERKRPWMYALSFAAGAALGLALAVLTGIA